MTTVFELRRHASRSTPRPQPTPDQFAITESSLLAAAVHAAVRRMDSASLRPAARPDGSPTVRPKLLLALLTICYAHQIYGSKQVVEWVRSEVNWDRLGPDPLPDVPTLCHFRREYREALHSCLTETLRVLAEQKVAAGVLTKVSEAQLAEEARRRIIMAMFVDSMEEENQPQADAPVDLCYLFAKGR